MLPWLAVIMMPARATPAARLRRTCSAKNPDAEQGQPRRLTGKQGIRRAVARPYPYVIFYRPDTMGIVVHAVRHAARKPL
jgi:plasmid stabilization system protein ParE